MLKLRGILAFVALILSLSQSHIANAAVKSSSQSFYYPKSHVAYSFFAIQEDILVYAVCDDKNIDITAEKNCTIVQRQYPYDKVTRACNVTLPVRHPHPDNANLTLDIQVQAFSKENAIIFWSELNSRTTFNLMAIQLDSCNTKLLRLEDHQRAIYEKQICSRKIVPYNDEFDIFIDQSQQTANVIDTSDGFRIGFDHDIQPIHDNINSSGYDFVKFILPIDEHSREKGYVYKAFKKGSYFFVLSKPNGTRKLLASGHLGMSSANYGYITSCINMIGDSHLRCTQYDENGKEKFVYLTHEGTKLLDVLTTPSGGFLLVTFETCWNEPTHYNFIRVGADGTRLGSIRSIDFTDESLGKPSYSVWENGDDEHCYTLLRQSSSRRGFVQIDINCFSDSDLLK